MPACGKNCTVEIKLEPSSVNSSRATRIRVLRVLSECWAFRLMGSPRGFVTGSAWRRSVQAPLDIHTACTDKTCSPYVASITRSRGPRGEVQDGGTSTFGPL